MSWHWPGSASYQPWSLPEDTLIWSHSSRCCVQKTRRLLVVVSVWRSVLPGRHLLRLMLLGSGFYEPSVLKMNDKKMVLKQFVAVKPLRCIVKQAAHLGVCFESRDGISTLCRGTLKTDSLCDSAGRRLWEISQMEIRGANETSPLCELALS